MTVVDVEYQFDRHKITIYYDSPLRIDFRELVRDLFSSFKVMLLEMFRMLYTLWLIICIAFFAPRLAFG